MVVMVVVGEGASAADDLTLLLFVVVVVGLFLRFVLGKFYTAVSHPYFCKSI